MKYSDEFDWIDLRIVEMRDRMRLWIWQRSGFQNFNSGLICWHFMIAADLNILLLITKLFTIFNQTN